MYLIDKSKIITYLGNMMTISFAGALLLLLIMGMGRIILLTPRATGMLVLGTAGLMLAEHMRRMKLLGINLVASAGWVVYRLLVVGVMLL
jgi:hypothetical protein